MSPENLCFWLQGFLEISNQENQELSAQQVQIIKDHLALVFKKETPVYTSTRISYPVPIDGYGVDLNGIKLSDIKLPIYGDQFRPMGDRIQDGWPNGMVHYTGIGEMQKDSWLHSYEWCKERNCWVVVNPNTPVEITTTPFVQWDGIQVSC